MKQKPTSIFLVILAAALWASSGVFVSIILANSDLSPLHLAFIREVITFILLLSYILLREKKLPNIAKEDWLWLALMGAIGIGFFHVLWNYSVLLNGVSIGTMLQYNEVVLVSIAAVFLFGEKMNWRKFLAILGSVVGTALISGIVGLDITHISTIGLVIGLASAIIHGGFSLLAKKLTGSYSPVTILMVTFFFGTLALIPFQFFTPPPTYVEPAAVASIFALILGASLIAFTAYATALRTIPVSIAAVLATSEVLIAALFGWLFLQEQLGIWQIAGGALIVGGILLVSLSKKSQVH